MSKLTKNVLFTDERLGENIKTFSDRSAQKAVAHKHIEDHFLSDWKSADRNTKKTTMCASGCVIKAHLILLDESHPEKYWIKTPCSFLPQLSAVAFTTAECDETKLIKLLQCDLISPATDLSHKHQYLTPFTQIRSVSMYVEACWHAQSLFRVFMSPYKTENISCNLKCSCCRSRKGCVRSSQVCVQVILLTELVCDRDAGEILAPVTLDGVDVEENSQGGEETQKD